MTIMKVMETQSVETTSEMPQTWHGIYQAVLYGVKVSATLQSNK